MRILFNYIRPMTLVAALLIVTGQANGSCSGRNPGELMAILKTTIQTGTAETAPIWWKDCLQPGFAAWSGGGSQNLPVVAAAIGMFDRVNTTNPAFDDFMQGSTKTYVQWWKEFLEAQTGVNTQPNPGQIRYFHGTEAGSNIYDSSVVSTVAVMNYWGRKYASKSGSNGTLIADRAREFLRATWVIFGHAAGQTYADEYFVGTKLDDNNQPIGPERVFNQYYPRKDGLQSGIILFTGRFIALPGWRSPLAKTNADDKGPTFARAMQNIASRMNENYDQRELLNDVEGRWPALGISENLYGLGSSDRTSLSTLIQDGSNASSFLSWITKIRTARTFRILGWSNGVRASVVEENANFNTPCMFAITYDPATKNATFLNTWTDANGSTQGWARLESGRIVAWHDDDYNANGAIRHPKMKAFIPILTSNPVFHLVLSQNTAPYLDGTPAWNYPPGLPPRTDWPLNY